MAQERILQVGIQDDAVDQTWHSLLVERMVGELAEVKPLDLLVSPHSPGDFLGKSSDFQSFQVAELPPAEHRLYHSVVVLINHQPARKVLKKVRELRKGPCSQQWPNLT